MERYPHVFVFNTLQVNTYLAFDSSGDCLVIDPACSDENERFQLTDFIAENSLKPVAVVNTHGHVDHLLGVNAICRFYSIPFYMHVSDRFLLDSAVAYGKIFGLNLDAPPVPDRFIHEGEKISYGNSEISLIHVPGHSPGSLVFLSHKGKWLITGDVLFSGSIGRTDLPGGDYEALVSGIHDKLLILPDEYRVYPGHGPYTTIGRERTYNPFLT